MSTDKWGLAKAKEKVLQAEAVARTKGWREEECGMF